MAIVDYASLKTAVYNWLDRTPGVNADSSFADRVDDGILLGESFLNRRLRAREMITTANLTTSAGSAALPTDFLAIKNVIWNGSPPDSLTEVDDAEFEKKYAGFGAGSPEVYLIRGANLLIAPYDDTGNAITLVYYQKLAGLSGSSTTNWLITKYPDVYLFTVLTEMQAFAQNVQIAMAWKARRDEVMEETWRSGQFYRGPASAVRPIGPTP